MTLARRATLYGVVGMPGNPLVIMPFGGKDAIARLSSGCQAHRLERRISASRVETPAQRTDRTTTFWSGKVVLKSMELLHVYCICVL